MKPILKITKRQTIFRIVEAKILSKSIFKRSRTHLLNYPVPMAILAFDYIGNEIAIHGMYELDELNNLFELLDGFKNEFKNGTACDVGANIGNHSRFFAAKFDKVISFEPNPLITDILKFNTKFFPNITVIENALGNYEGKAIISGNKQNIGGVSAVENRDKQDQEYSENNSMSSTVKVITLDSMLDQLKNLHFMKIDVEGFEWQVIDGALKTIFKFKPIIAFEQWPSDFANSKSKVIELLVELGYVFYWQNNYYSSSNTKFNYARKLGQSIRGIKKIFFYKSIVVPPGHYSLLVAVHNSKIHKIDNLRN